jgi:Divergent InlB B-repeat domain
VPPLVQTRVVVGALSQPQDQPQKFAPPRSMPLSPSGDPSYDEQLGMTFTQSFTSMLYNVTAVAQQDPTSGAGPAYLLQGLSNTGYWYQVSLVYNWPYVNSGYNPGFHAGYEVFDSSGNSVFPVTCCTGFMALSGSVNSGDSVALNLYFTSSGQVIMLVQDLNTGAAGSETYSAEGATYFVGLSSGTANSNGFFTGLMTEWYHPSPYYGNEQAVVYASSFALSSAWMWIDEYEPPCCSNSLFGVSTSGPDSYTSNPTLLQEFSSNGATEYSNARTFITGALSLASMTFSYSVNGGGTSYLPPVLSYYENGAYKSATLNGYATAYQMDVGSQWSVSSVLSGSGSNERWGTAQSTAGVVGSAQTINFAYYHQDFVTFAISVQGGGSGYSPPEVSYLVFGASSTTPSGVGVWADAGSSYSFSNPLPGSQASERWYAGPSANGLVTLAGTISVAYYHQFAITVSYQVEGGGSPSPPTVSGTYLGQVQSNPLSGTPSVGWLDTGSQYQLSQTLPGSTSSERWYGNGGSGVVNGPVSLTATYYHQFYVSVSFSIVGGGSPTAPTLTYEIQDSPASLTMTTAPYQMWVDDNGWSVPQVLGGSSVSERWTANAGTNGTLNSDLAISPKYYHQFSFSGSFSTSDNSNAVPPRLSSSSFGAPFSTPLGVTPATYWLDGGASWSTTSLLNGSGSTERWITTLSTSGIISSAKQVSIEYQHQFYATIEAAESQGGTVTPSGWYNATSSLRLSAQSNPGWQFEGWAGQTAESYSGTSSSTSITVSSPLIENATFYPGLSLVDGANGQVSYSWGSAHSTVASGNETIYVPVGTRLSLSAAPSSILFVFHGYTGALNSANSTASVVVSGPALVNASFTPNYPVIGGIVGGAALVAVGLLYVFRIRRSVKAPS